MTHVSWSMPAGRLGARRGRWCCSGSGDGGHELASSCGRCRRCDPVRVRNTSSRVGWRRLMSSTAIWASVSSLAASDQRLARPGWWAAVTERAPASTLGSAPVMAATMRVASAQVAGLDHHDLDLVAADLPLELAGVAPGDDPAVVDDDDVVGQALGLLQVLRGEHDGGAACRRGCRSRSTARCGRGGRGRWWARRGTAPRAGRRGWRPGRGGGACRPSTPTSGRSAASVEGEVVEQLGRPGRGLARGGAGAARPA